MTHSIIPPRGPEQISQTKRRVSDIERRLSRPIPTPTGYIAKFSLHGSLFLSTSGIDMHPIGGKLLLVYGALDVAGTTSTVVSLRKNGVEFDTLSFPAGRTHNEVSLNVNFSPRVDEFQVAITTVGTGAKSLSVFGMFDR